MNSSENQVKRLTVDDIAVPAGMLSAALNEYTQFTEKRLAAALLWLAENPIVPSKAWLDERAHAAPIGMTCRAVTALCIEEWQKIMFLRKQEEFPKELEPLATAVFEFRVPVSDQMRERLLKAYKLGKEDK